MSLQDAIYYTLIGNDKAMEYFYVDPKTGVVSLKKSILTDSTARYDVSYSYQDLLSMSQKWM